MSDERDPTPIVGEWARQKQYRCRLCDFDTLEEAKFVDHFRKAHPPLRIIEGGAADAAETKPSTRKGEKA
jgi:hypothetical protein